MTHWICALAAAIAPAVNWEHPAGMITRETIAGVQAKLEAHAWAREVYSARKRSLQPWVETSVIRLAEVFPTTRGNVYHNFSTPDSRLRLEFDPFSPDAFRDPATGAVYPPETDAGIYPEGHRYHGTMYDGWVCLFYLTAASAAADLALIGRIEDDAAVIARTRDLLLLFASTLQDLPVDRGQEPQFDRILTYHREGDNKVLFDLAVAYELVRDGLTPAQRAHIESAVLERLLNDIMLEPVYRYDHNNVYQWHRTVLQTAMALEREDLIDWSFGYGAHAPEAEPEHRSVRRILAAHFNADGAFWELCSGYHLYPLYHLCELAVLSRNLHRMDPNRFPSSEYDLTRPDAEGGRVIHNALEWFMAAAMPDRTIPVIGDSTVPRAGMLDYAATAEVGYHHFNVRAVGDYRALREGKRSWVGLLHGAPEVVQRFTPYRSSNLSSGWVALRGQHAGNQVWAGLNALIPGGGHQHADRLTLVTYSHDALLALEKTTPYNEEVTRVLGTLTQAHNTVVVDSTSQPQGELLTGSQVPKVAAFFATPLLQYAEAHADDVYPNTSQYRRRVAIVEDVILDYFTVSGGDVHDWLVNHAGDARPSLSFSANPDSFAPEDWLYNGTEEVLSGRPGGHWEAQWQTGGVTSRLTMAGAPATTVYSLETYPVDNAVITPAHPPCPTLCVRRTQEAPFLAVWDAWRGAPRLNHLSFAGVPATGVHMVTDSGLYRAQFGPGEARFDDGARLATDGAFALIRGQNAAVMINGAWLEFEHGPVLLRIETDTPCSLAAQHQNGRVELEISGPIQYDTVGGRDRYRDAPRAKITISGSAWQVRETWLHFAGHEEPLP